MLVKEYFPVSVVVPTILEIYQNLLNVQFVEIKNDKTWHPGKSSYVFPFLQHRVFVRPLLTHVCQMSNNSPSGKRTPRTSPASSATATSTSSPASLSTRTQRFGLCSAATRRRTAREATRSRRWWRTWRSRPRTSLRLCVMMVGGLACAELHGSRLRRGRRCGFDGC